MTKYIYKTINTILISIVTIGTAFCLYSCGDVELDVVDLALANLKLELKDVHEPLYLAKQIFFNYEDIEYSFTLDWSYTSQDHWKDLIDKDNNTYMLESKEYYDEFDFDLTATIVYEESSKSKTFHGNYKNINIAANGIDSLYSLEENEEITLEGMAINIFKSNYFVFHDGKESILVEINDGESIIYNVKIEVVLKKVKNIINVDGEDIERITAKYVSHRSISGAYVEKLSYKSIPYSLEELCNYSNCISVDNYNKLNQNIVQTNGIITLQNDEYYICENGMSLKLFNPNNKFFEMLVSDFKNTSCTIDLFVDFIIEDNVVVVDYSFYIINIFTNN